MAEESGRRGARPRGGAGRVRGRVGVLSRRAEAGPPGEPDSTEGSTATTGSKIDLRSVRRSGARFWTFEAGMPSEELSTMLHSTLPSPHWRHSCPVKRTATTFFAGGGSAADCNVHLFRCPKSSNLFLESEEAISNLHAHLEVLRKPLQTFLHDYYVRINHHDVFIDKSYKREGSEEGKELRAMITWGCNHHNFHQLTM